MRPITFKQTNAFVVGVGGCATRSAASACKAFVKTAAATEAPPVVPLECRPNRRIRCLLRLLSFKYLSTKRVCAAF